MFTAQKPPVGARSSDPGRASPARKTSVSKDTVHDNYFPDLRQLINNSFSLFSGITGYNMFFKDLQ